jgi:hypothetical protein
MAVAARKTHVYMGGGGLYRGRISITKMSAVLSDFGPQLKIEYLTPEGDEKWDTVSQSPALVPDEDGAGFEPAPGTDPKMANHGYDMAPFISALEESGFPMSKLDKGDFTVLEGHDFILERPVTKNDDGSDMLSTKKINPKTNKGYPIRHVILTKYLGPTGGGDEDEDEGDVADKAAEALAAALKKSPKITKAVAKSIVNRSCGKAGVKLFDDAKALSQLARAGKFTVGKDGSISRR